MFIAALVISSLYAALLVFSATGKLRHDPAQMKTLTSVGVSRRFVPVLASLEIAAALGLAGGLAWWPLGVAAGVGITLYFVGALIAHLRVKDGSGARVPAVLLVVSLAALILRLLSI